MSPAVKTHKIAAHRIEAYVGQHFGGNARLAARTLGVKHNTLWRAMKGHAVRGPSISVCDALELHSGTPMRFWRGLEVPA